MSSSSSIISTLIFVQQQIVIYTGIPILIAGVLGGLLNIVVFLSLRTFRQSSCAFYLTVMSFANIGFLLLGLFSRIMISGYAIDWTDSSLSYCKLRYFCLFICAQTSLTCMCLSTSDQYLATSSLPRWQQWSNIKLARRLTVVFAIFWILYAIPYSVYYNQIVSPTTGGIICTLTNITFQKYSSYFDTLIMGSVLPIFVTTVFGFMAHRNVQQLAYRTVPLVRRELDKQLTKMVLAQVLCNCFTLVPYIITDIIILNTNTIQDPVIIAQLQLANLITHIVYYADFATPVYIYICVSKRFRQQFIYVIFEIHVKMWRRRITGVAANQVLPQT